ncbi:carbamoyltransferase HypF [Ferrimonas senticii]|uniref:carbamoyltransferase HypF n=1 Tax=Ferrimonas senticii TaxID=394566 RepID=UPI00040D7F89|nr:carbamoyltransferase HypF [Ferrimonas senticii]
MTVTQPGAQIRVRGQVQGVGFRPFIWQLAQQLQVGGEVLNDAEGVLIKLSPPQSAYQFLTLMLEQLPPLARIDSTDIEPWLQASYPDQFVITASVAGNTNTRIAPDTATCEQCRHELFEPSNRRYQYPFTNCTHCGPRYSIIQDVPYDRPHTSMAAFPLCADCQQEYDYPADRRFHAQPNACSVCGPTLQLRHNSGRIDASGQQALVQTVAALKRGEIVAVKGLGGFHLVVDGCNQQAVMRLRQRKHRPAKPFALMAADLTIMQRYVKISKAEQQQLQSGAAPIVLLRRRDGGRAPIAAAVAPDLHVLGMMLPSNPLQHLLLSYFDTPLVMTSGNASGKPPCIDDASAISELGEIADWLLLHDRAIVNRVDDSIVRVDSLQGRVNVSVLRRARGLVPTPISLPAGFAAADNLLAYGADLKNTFCYLKQGQALLSPHLGDLADLQLRQSYQDNLQLFAKLFAVTADLTACDSHPNYISHGIATEQGEPQTVDHHHAHLAACLVDNQIPLTTAPVLGLVLDGLGWGGIGTDHQLWGGELLYGDYRQVRHLTGLPALPLAGGELAARQPWRNLLVHLDAAVPDWQQRGISALERLQQKPLATLRQGIAAGINSPRASSAGRLFDAVAALLTDKFDAISFEGEAALAVEALAWQALPAKQHTMPPLAASDPISLQSLWTAMLTAIERQVSAAEVALQFHQHLAALLLTMVAKHARPLAVTQVALSGGVMQNQLLLMLLVDGLQQLGLSALVHSEIPANDGGIAIGQAAVAWARQCDLTDES